MIELIAAAVSGAVVGQCIVWFAWKAEHKLDRTLIASQRGLIQAQFAALEDATTTLTALRSNCFIPDERGVKVRYSQASVERRIKAETPRADKV